jgi:hypothetical protein
LHEAASKESSGLNAVRGTHSSEHEKALHRSEDPDRTPKRHSAHKRTIERDNS